MPVLAGEGLSIGRWVGADCGAESIFMTGLLERAVLGVCDG